MKFRFEGWRAMVGDVERPRRRLDPVRRPQILATTVELLQEHGLWSVRVVDVANRAGISAASVVYYFGTKDQLFAQAIAAADDAFYDALRPELERLDSAIDRLVWLIKRSCASDWVLWIDLWGYSRHHPETVATQKRFHDRWRSAIAEIITYGTDSGAWAAGEVAAISQRLAALTGGLAVHMVLGDRDHGPDRYVEMSLAAAALELGLPASDLDAAASRVTA